MHARSADQTRTASREDWLKARLDLLAREKAATRALDELRAARRRLPWVRLEKDYVFETLQGRVSLAELFGGRSQLAVYHFMLPPESESDHICDGCAFLADHVDAARQHFEQADLAFAAVSRAAPGRIEAVRRRFGWSFTWVSSGANDFNFDFGVSFTPDEIAAGQPLYNYGTSSYLHHDLPGASIFAKDASGHVHHTYSTYTRGLELLVGAFNWLDLTPKGRNEEGIMSWVRLHDEYQPLSTMPAHSCCAAE
jgi:predicted dithiol-disulfide oxidoreductase (DUF899 family)